MCPVLTERCRVSAAFLWAIVTPFSIDTDVQGRNECKSQTLTDAIDAAAACMRFYSCCTVPECDLEVRHGRWVWPRCHGETDRRYGTVWPWRAIRHDLAGWWPSKSRDKQAALRRRLTSLVPFFWTSSTACL
jgi:hypothetical protein